MSTDVKLNPGEMVIKSSNEIGYGGGLSRQNNELILTNQSLILVHKNLFGKTKEVLMRNAGERQEKASPQWEMPEKRSYGYAACRWGGSFSPIISASSEGVGMTP